MQGNQGHTQVAERDESVWVYLAANQRALAGSREAFVDGLADVCEGFGFTVFHGGDDRSEASDTWLEALRYADICIIELGAASAVAGAELAMACSSGRPLVVLRRCEEESPAALRAMLAEHSGAREVAFDDFAECSEKLHALLGDPAWQHLVRHATVVEDL
jgi:hypothetical protein